jgi:broad-specificity NMP kinase
MKIIFVTGPSGVGKTTFIQKKFSQESHIHIFDLSLKAKELFGSYEALDHESQSVKVYNEASSEAFFALIEDGKDVVAEYLTDGYDDELFALINKAHAVGLRPEVITLTADADTAWERVQHAGSDYFPAAKSKEITAEILMGVLEDFELNQDFEKICEVGGEGGTISFYRYVRGGENRFFFSTDETALFDFKPEFEFEQIEGVNYVEEFSNFPEAFQALLEKYPIFRLVPIEVNPNYKSEFKEAYHRFLELEGSDFEETSWHQHIN